MIWGLGVLRFSPAEFWEQMDYSELTAAIEGYQLASEMEWERTRYLASIVLSPHMSKGKVPKPKDLMRLPRIDGIANFDKLNQQTDENRKAITEAFNQPKNLANIHKFLNTNK